MPPGYDGPFGPGVVTLVLGVYFGGQLSEAKSVALLRSVDLKLSAGHVSDLLLKARQPFHTATAAVVEAGLARRPWQHVDDTGTRGNGQHQHGHILCTPRSTAYHTAPSKDRRTVLDVVRNGRPRGYRLKAEALGSLAALPGAATTRRRLLHLPRDQGLDEATLEHLLAAHLPRVGAQHRTWLVDALAVAASHAQANGPIVRLLIGDEGGQFPWLTEDLALWWVHAGRHYTPLAPFLPQHRAALTTFLTDLWAYSAELLAYRQAPTAAERARLETAFDTLFGQQTGYDRLDERIASTRAKKAALLQVLAHPDIPRHNNPADLGARQRVRQRDGSFGPRPGEGARAWDTFMTLADTAKKRGVRFYRFSHDRVSGANHLPSLAEEITRQARWLDLGASWMSPQSPPTF